jgi:hypothetical protein
VPPCEIFRLIKTPALRRKFACANFLRKAGARSFTPLLLLSYLLQPFHLLSHLVFYAF